MGGTAASRRSAARGSETRLLHNSGMQEMRAPAVSAAMSSFGEPFVARVDDYLAGLQAAKRSQHTIDGYRSDLLGVGRRIASAGLVGQPGAQDPVTRGPRSPKPRTSP